jgi:hypothetical protein
MSAISPYVLPSTLINAPTGIDWTSLPYPNADDNLQLTTQYQMCLLATHAAEAFCNQNLRATIDVQTESAPSRKVSVNRQGVAVLITDNWPVLAVVSISCAANGVFPPAYNLLNSNQYMVGGTIPVNTGSAIPGGSAQGVNKIFIAPGIVTWGWGKENYLVQATYINGWPHAGIVQQANPGDTTMHVDDVTGWTIATSSNPIVATVEDGSNTEVVNIIGTSPTGTATSGPGTLTLQSPLSFEHDGPTNGMPACLVTTLPATVQKAVIWLAISESLVRGATAITAMSMPGTEMHSGADASLDMLAFEALLPYKRVVP